MGVDRRHDHSFRVPRPDFTERFGTPNACTPCHADKTAGVGVGRAGHVADAGVAAAPAFAETFAAARQGRADAAGGAGGDCVRRASAGHGARLGPGTAAGRRRRPTRGLARRARRRSPTAGPAGRRAGLAAARAGGARPRRRPPARGSAAVHPRRCGVGAGWGARRVAAGGQRQALERSLGRPARSEAFNGDRPGVVRQPGLARGASSATSRRPSPSTKPPRSTRPGSCRPTSTWRNSSARAGNEAGRRADVAPCAGGGARRCRRALRPGAVGVSPAAGRAKRSHCWPRLRPAAPTWPAIRLPTRWRSNRRASCAEALKVIDAARVRHPDDRDLLDAGLSIAQEGRRHGPRSRVRAPAPASRTGGSWPGPVGSRTRRAVTLAAWPVARSPGARHARRECRRYSWR